MAGQLAAKEPSGTPMGVVGVVVGGDSEVDDGVVDAAA
jgi:hypothetical protein